MKAAVERGEMTVVAAIRGLRGTMLPNRYNKLAGAGLEPLLR